MRSNTALTINDDALVALAKDIRSAKSTTGKVTAAVSHKMRTRTSDKTDSKQPQLFDADPANGNFEFIK